MQSINEPEGGTATPAPNTANTNHLNSIDMKIISILTLQVVNESILANLQKAITMTMAAITITDQEATVTTAAKEAIHKVVI